MVKKWIYVITGVICCEDNLWLMYFSISVTLRNGVCNCALCQWACFSTNFYQRIHDILVFC